MWMICWHYCEDLGRLLYHTAPLLMVVMALFAFKRAYRSGQSWPRAFGLVLLVVAAAKVFLFDPYLFRGYLACAAGLPFLPCNRTGGAIIMTLGAMIFIGLMVAIYYLQGWLKSLKPRPRVTPQQVRLRLWANASLVNALALSVWAILPWLWALAQAHLPDVLLVVPWHVLAVTGATLLAVGFWLLEDCRWFYIPMGNKAKAHDYRVWTPRDTLWTALLIYVVALALAYVTQDVIHGT